MLILFMDSQMLGKLTDSLCKKCYLNLSGTCIIGMMSVSFDELLLFFIFQVVTRCMLSFDLETTIAQGY